MTALPEITNLEASVHSGHQIAVGWQAGEFRYHFFLPADPAQGDDVAVGLWRKSPTIYKNKLEPTRDDKTILLDATSGPSRLWLAAIKAQKSFDQLRQEARESAIASERQRLIEAAEAFRAEAIKEAGPSMLRTLDAIAGDIAKFRKRCEEAEHTDTDAVSELLASIEGLCKLEGEAARKPGRDALAKAEAYNGEG